MAGSPRPRQTPGVGRRPWSLRCGGKGRDGNALMRRMCGACRRDRCQGAEQERRAGAWAGVVVAFMSSRWGPQDQVEGAGSGARVWAGARCYIGVHVCVGNCVDASTTRDPSTSAP